MDIETILACPDCTDGPIRNNRCDACGNEFAVDAGIPLLFPKEIDRRFQTDLISLEQAQDILSHCFKRPSSVGASPDIYHLDLAHIPYFENLRKGSIVLEIGCGGGQMRKWVQSMGLNYIGTDVSKERVHEHLREFGGPDFLSDAHQLPIKTASVDLVYSAAVTEHLSAPHRAMQEIFRVLKPGGIFLGNCSFMEPWHDDSFFHISPNGAAVLLAQAGFEPLAIWPSHNYSGYKSLMQMGNGAARLMRPAGAVMQKVSNLFYVIKRQLRGEKYSDQSHLLDLAITAGAIDWAAQKPLDAPAKDYFIGR